MIIYGIPNCNTVKKAQNWLTENEFSFEFHDFKKKGVTEVLLHRWCDTFGWERVLNKKGTTWRKFTPEVQRSVTDQASAIELMLVNTSAIKRPIVEVEGTPILLSFDEEQYKEVLKKI